MSRRNHSRVYRTCVGCNRVDEKRAMTRIVFNDGEIIIDQAQAMAGRGGYLHEEQRCLRRFVKRKVTEFRSLRRGIPVEERARVVKLIAGAGSELQSAELR